MLYQTSQVPPSVEHSLFFRDLRRQTCASSEHSEDRDGAESPREIWQALLRCGHLVGQLEDLLSRQCKRDVANAQTITTRIPQEAQGDRLTVSLNNGNTHISGHRATGSLCDCIHGHGVTVHRAISSLCPQGVLLQFSSIVQTLRRARTHPLPSTSQYVHVRRCAS